LGGNEGGIGDGWQARKFYFYGPVLNNPGTSQERDPEVPLTLNLASSSTLEIEGYRAGTGGGFRRVWLSVTQE
jgi:hypothetical protein